MRLAALSFASGLALLVPEVAAAGVCYANNAVTLKDCVDRAKAGDEVEVATGEYLLLQPLKITEGITVRAKTRGTAILKYRGTLDASKVFVSKESYFLDKAQLIEVDAKDEAVLIQGLVFEPPAGRAVVIGRALHVTGGDVELTDCRLSPYDLDLDTSTDPMAVNNASDTADDTGGMLALVEESATLSLRGTRVDSVEAPYTLGSAVVARGPGTTVKLIGPTEIVNNISAYGAVAAVDGARIEVLTDDEGVAPTLEDNVADVGGALMAIAGSKVEVYAGFFRRNRAGRGLEMTGSAGGHLAAIEGSEIVVYGGQYEDGLATLGGSIAGFDSMVALHGGNFVSASARNGGHIGLMDLYEGTLPTSLVMTGGQIGGGVAELSAEEVFANDAVPDSSVLYVPYGGGAFLYGGTADISGGSFDGNTVTEQLGAGGALYLQSASLDAADPRFTGNTGSRGGAIYALFSPLVLDAGTFSANGRDTDLAGGAIQADWSDVSVDGTVFSGNRARSGGALTCFGEQTCTVADATFDDNHATWGGAIYAHNEWTSLDGVVFRDNVATELGGHLYATSGQIDETTSIFGAMNIAGGRFEGGDAGHGGAAEVVGVSATVRGTAFVGNEARGLDAPSGVGGAWVQKGATLLIEGATFQRNTSGYGGAVFGLDAQDTTIRDTLFERNGAQYGGAVALTGGGGGELVRNVFQGNIGAGVSAVMVQGPDAWAADLDVTIASNVIDGEGETTYAAVAVENKFVKLHHNDLVDHGGPAVLFNSADVEFRHNLVGYGSSPVLGVFGSTASVSHAFNAWWRSIEVATSPIATDTGAEIEVGPGAVLDNPRIRGALGGELPTVRDSLAVYHPRPWSPLLLDGYPADRTDAHIGIFGGQYQFLSEWVSDADIDDVPRIFDCDDSDHGIGDRLVQYVDADGDGVGRELWAGDDCVMVSGNVLVDGDCDDTDGTVWDLCGVVPEGVAYYGATCSHASGAHTVPLALLLGLLVVRRRRRMV